MESRNRGSQKYFLTTGKLAIGRVSLDLSRFRVYGEAEKARTRHVYSRRRVEAMVFCRRLGPKDHSSPLKGTKSHPPIISVDL